MSSASPTTQQRLIQAALDLFLSQGIHNTTTRQIANLADVNEVTLFRNFGNKYGLLQAVIEDSTLFTQLSETLVRSFNPVGALSENLRNYAHLCLQFLEQQPDFIRSLIGESDQYSEELRVALERKLWEAHQPMVQILSQFLESIYVNPALPSEKLLYLTNGMLLAYAVLGFTSRSQAFWPNRDVFLEALVQFCLGSLLPKEEFSSSVGSVEVVPAVQDLQQPAKISDLPANLVHEILQRSRKAGLQDYALAYLLFGAGLMPEDLVGLLRAQQISDAQQHVLQVSTAQGTRQVPVNQWILGRRYGSYTNNPLTKWLRSRKDQSDHLLIDEMQQSLSTEKINQYWLHWTEGLVTTEGKKTTIAQAQQTWMVEMLMRGVSLENLSILTGLAIAQLQPYAHRAREKTALEQAMQLDQKGKGGATKV